MSEIMDTPLISIIMPVFNVGEYVANAVESILSQTFNNFELIIIDDGSTDKTIEKIEKFNDERIRLFRRNHEGFIDQLNFGLEISSADLIARMDGDDTMDAKRLQLQYEFLMNNKNIHLVGTNFNYIDKKDTIIVKKDLPEFSNEIEFMMPIIPSVLHPTILTYKTVIQTIGGYSTDFLCEDVVIFMKLFSSGYKMYNIQLPLYNYRLIIKPDTYYKEHYSDYYKYSNSYLNRLFENKIIPDWNFNFRMGLLEYYMGKLSKARKYFYKCFKFNQIKKKVLLRYLIISYVGKKLLNFLRKKRITEKANFLIKNLLNIDTNFIKVTQTDRLTEENLKI